MKPQTHRIERAGGPWAKSADSGRDDAHPRELIDLRLALTVLAAWAATLWGLSRPSAVSAVAAVGALGLAVVLLAAGRRWPKLYPLALGCCGIALVLAPLAVRLHGARDSDLARLAIARVEVTAEVKISSDPRPLAAKGAAGSPRMVVDGSLVALTVAGHRTSIGGPVLLLGPLDAWRRILPGQRVRIDARLAPPLGDDLLLATLSTRTDPELLGAPPWWQRVAGSIRAGLQRAAAKVGGQAGGLLPGLVDGDTSQLDPVLADRFRTAGLTHLVAVSGTNCSIMVGSVALVLRRLRASPRTTILVGVLVLAAFVVVARPSPSVLRAAVMAAVALVALAAGRPRSAMPVLAASVFALLLWTPALAVNLGFVLSVSATASLILIAPGWAGALHRRGVPSVLAEGLAVAAAAHLVTAPLVVGITGQFSLVAIPANLLAEPVVGLATVLGVLTAAAAVPLPGLASVLAQLAGVPCRWLVWVAERCGGVAGATVPWPSGVPGGFLLAAVMFGLVVLARHGFFRLLLATGLVAALLVQIPVRALVQAWPATGWLIVACDVGQGDALVLNDGPGRAVLIDAGPDPVAVDRCLRQLGVQHIAMLVLTHDHLDHVGGLSGVFHERKVDEVVVSPLNEPATGHRLIIDVLARHGLKAKYVSTGTEFNEGEVQLSVLGPAKAFHGTRSDPNNSSLILRAVVHGVSIMLPGDAEIEAQDALLAAGTAVASDILKVPHHGSAYSDPAFLQAVHPRLALVSVGRNNDYGHPSPLLIAEMARLGVPTYRTDQLGDIAVVQDGQETLAPVTHATRSGNAIGSARNPAGGVFGQ